MNFGNLAGHPMTLLVLVLIIVVVFGANRLPGAARSLGRSLRIFKSEVKAMHDDDDAPKNDAPLEGKIVDSERRAHRNQNENHN